MGLSQSFAVYGWLATPADVADPAGGSVVGSSVSIIHRVNGREVLRYQHPQLDPKDESARRLLAAGAPLALSYGHIALQAESQPVWFRNIRIRQLDR